jgi:carboxylate-amine ligase
MRYGIDESLLDLAKGELVPVPDLIEEIQAIVEKDADALGCQAEIAHLTDIVTRGTSAHRQVSIYEQALAEGRDEKDALKEVVRWLIDETAIGAQ